MATLFYQNDSVIDALPRRYILGQASPQSIHLKELVNNSDASKQSLDSSLASGRCSTVVAGAIGIGAICNVLFLGVDGTLSNGNSL